MPTRPTQDDWADDDIRGADGTAAQIAALVARVRRLEAQQQADHSTILALQTRLGLINAILHLW